MYVPRTCSFECPCQYFHFRFVADKRLEGLGYDTEKPEDIPVKLISITSKRLASHADVLTGSQTFLGVRQVNRIKSSLSLSVYITTSHII